MGIHIGLDFGTSTISAAVWYPESDSVKVMSAIVREIGPVPNAIFYAKQDQLYIGMQAKKRSLVNPQHYISEIKRELTRDGWSRRIFDEEKTAESIATDIFVQIKENIERNFGNEHIESVVITVPFAFLYKERLKILEAAKAAGLPVVQLIEEPVAAALAAGVLQDTTIQHDENLFVFDFGGGTLDMTIFRKQIDAATGAVNIEVVTTDGDVTFGGKDVDQLLISQLTRMLGVDLSIMGVNAKVEKFKVKIAELAELIKKSFTHQQVVHEFFIDDWQNTHDIKIDYDTFKGWLDNGLLYRLTTMLDDMLFEVNLKPSNIDRVILVGGSSYLKPVQQKLSRYFQQAPIVSDDLSTLVAKGAGIYCGLYNKNLANISVKQKVSHHIGLNINGKMEPVLLRNTPYGAFSHKVPLPSKKVAIYQGNSLLLDTCRKIGFYDISEQFVSVENCFIQIGSTEHGMLIVRFYNGEHLHIELPMAINI